MRELIGMKILADLCFGVAVLSWLPWYQDKTVFLLLVMLCGGISMELSALWKERGVLRFLPLLLVGAPLLAFRGIPQYIAVSATALYILARMIGRGYQVIYWQYLTQSKAMIPFMLVTLFASLVRAQTVPETFALIFLYFALNSYALRQSRLGRYADQRSGILNILYLLGCCLLAVVLAAVLTGLYSLNWQDAAQVLMMPFAWLLYGLSWIYNLLGKGIRKGNEAENNNQNLLDMNDEELREYSKEATANAGDGMDWTMPNIGKVLAVILIILLIAAVIYLLYRLIRRLLEQNVVMKQEEIYETQTLETAGERKKRLTGNRKKIRKYYQGYQSLLRSRGVLIQRFMTSQEILDENTDVSKIEEEKQLRQIYLKARYDEEGQPTSSDVQEIKELFDQIKKREKDDRNPG